MGRMTTLEQAHDQVKGLVLKFKSLSAAERRNLNENATRQGYILPLFRALGWDIENVNEVSPEEKVSRGWVDFAFRLGGIPRFFLETKKARHDHIVALVTEMLELQKEHAEAARALDDRRHRLAKRIEEVDRAIDTAVYHLYGLTEEEIRIVEKR